MDQKELKEKIDGVRTIIVDHVATAMKLATAAGKPLDPDIELAAGLGLIALDVVGGFLLDIKRIADAAEVGPIVVNTGKPSIEMHRHERDADLTFGR